MGGEYYIYLCYGLFMNVLDWRCCSAGYTPERSRKRDISSTHIIVVWKIIIFNVNTVQSYGK